MSLPPIGGQKPDDPKQELDRQTKETGPKPMRVREGASLVTTEDAADAIETLRNALLADRTVYGKTKSEFQTDPDWPTRIKAAELLLAYGEGRPVERRLEVRANAETWEATKTKQLQSPEGIRFLRASGAISADQAEEAMRKLGSIEE